MNKTLKIKFVSLCIHREVKTGSVLAALPRQTVEVEKTGAGGGAQQELPPAERPHRVPLVPDQPHHRGDDGENDERLQPGRSSRCTAL